jgi:hypothetical protein
MTPSLVPQTLQLLWFFFLVTVPSLHTGTDGLINHASPCVSDCKFIPDTIEHYSIFLPTDELEDCMNPLYRLLHMAPLIKRKFCNMVDIASPSGMLITRLDQSCMLSFS